MPISNETFESFRIQEKAKEQLNAINLLCKQGYTIFDGEGNRITKTNIESYK